MTLRFMEDCSKKAFKASIHPSAILEGVITIPTTTHIEALCVISIGENASLVFGERNTIYPSVVIRNSAGTIKTGNDVSLGPGVVIYEVREGLVIGDNTMIAAGVRICGTSHGTDQDRPMRKQPVKAQPVKIGDDVWIGMNAIIHPGVEIGKGSIIGSGSLVTKSIPEMSVAFGSPCRVRRKR